VICTSITSGPVGWVTFRALSAVTDTWKCLNGVLVSRSPFSFFPSTCSVPTFCGCPPLGCLCPLLGCLCPLLGCFRPGSG